MLEAGGGEVEYNLETDKTFSATLSLIRLKRIQYNTISFKINVADILKTIILVKPVVSIVIYTIEPITMMINWGSVFSKSSNKITQPN